MAIIVKREPDDNDDRMIARFRQLIIESKHLDTIKDRMFHISEGEKKKRREKERQQRKRSQRRY